MAAKEERKRNDLPFLLLLVAGVGIFAWTRRPVAPHGATLNGTLISDDGAPMQVSFEWGQTEELTSQTPSTEAQTGDHFLIDLTNLPKGQQYFFRAKAVGQAGTPVFGEVLSFVTPGV